MKIFKILFHQHDMVVNDRAGYSLTLTTLEGDWKQWNKNFQKLNDSVHYEKRLETNESGDFEISYLF